MAKDTRSINLLPVNNQGLLDQFLDWALTIGRLLIILTETVALGTFLYRFGLDRQLVDLHDQIKQESFIVKNFTEYENTYRDLQARIMMIKKYDANSAIAPKIFDDVINMGRGHLTFKTILVSTEILKVEAQAKSVSALTNFVNSIKHYPEVKSVSIEKVENKTSDAILIIGLSASLKSAGSPVPSIGPLKKPVQQQSGGY